MNIFAPRRADSVAKFKTDEWTVGWKAANLLVHGVSGQIRFAPIYQHSDKVEAYDVRADAICQSSWHKAPGKSCKCGFNAFGPNSLKEVLGYMSPAPGRGYAMVTDNLVILWVGLSGRILEGQVRGAEARAARAAHQRVAQVHMPQRCGSPDCFRQPVRLGVLGSGPERKKLREYNYLRPLCADHAPVSAITLERCAQKLGVPVVWYDPELM